MRHLLEIRLLAHLQNKNWFKRLHLVTKVIATKALVYLFQLEPKLFPQNKLRRESAVTTT